MKPAAPADYRELARRTADTEWIERWPGETTVPANLHEAQLAVRRSRSGATQ
jgi:hypothetical protein